MSVPIINDEDIIIDDFDIASKIAELAKEE